MKKSSILAIVLLIVLLAIVAIIALWRHSPSSAPVATIQGCYVAKQANDDYTLNVQSDAGGLVSGSLVFNNYEKDSSSGTFSGTYQNGILLADYSFLSEGLSSVMQVAFKKTNDGFVRGYGDVQTMGNRVSFIDPAHLTYTPPVFENVPCV